MISYNDIDILVAFISLPIGQRNQCNKNINIIPVLAENIVVVEEENHLSQEPLLVEVAEDGTGADLVHSLLYIIATFSRHVRRHLKLWTPVRHIKRSWRKIGLIYLLYRWRGIYYRPWRALRSIKRTYHRAFVYVH